MGERKPKSLAGKSDIPSLPENGIAGSVKADRGPSPRGHRYVSLIVAGVLVLAVVVAGIFVYNHRQAAKISSVCGNSIAHDASTQNKLQNQTTFGELVNQIKAAPNYDQDPNCLYIIAEYQMLMNDLDGAQISIDKLTNDYGEDYTFNRNLDDGEASIQHLQAQYDISKDAQDNSHGGIDPAI